MGIDNWKIITAYEINIDIDVLIKLGALFTKSGWEYYYWIDSFLEQLDADISKDTFFERIGWETVLTIIQCFEHKEKKKSKSVHK